MEGLTAGRMVHYVLDHEDGTWMTGAHRPAVIVRTLGESSTANGIVDLTVFVSPEEGLPNATTMYKNRIPHDPDGEHGTWHWIERV